MYNELNCSCTVCDAQVYPMGCFRKGRHQPSFPGVIKVPTKFTTRSIYMYFISLQDFRFNIKFVTEASIMAIWP